MVLNIIKKALGTHTSKTNTDQQKTDQQKTDQQKKNNPTHQLPLKTNQTAAGKKPHSTQTFVDLGLKEPITRAVKSEGYDHPTPIQAKAIPDILTGRDMLGCAQTGTGKTAAFALPMLHRLSEKQIQGHRIRALILAPTRELAIQIKDSFVVYGKHLPLRTTVVFGGVGLEPQIRSLKNGIDILVATPGRLLDLVQRGAVDFKSLEILVLDEADRMLDMGFIHDIRRILKLLPTKRQNLLFSATIPKEVQGLIDSILVNPVRVEVAPVSSTSERVSQRLYYVPRPDKKDLILQIINDENIQRALVFTRTKHNANKLERWLNQHKITAAAIHGNKSQNARQRALEGFKSGEVRILVASDIAARGIDIDDITHVINFEMPNEPETYVHRIGRTGRALATGVALSFCDHEELKHVRDIERVTKIKIPVISDHPWAMDPKTPPPPGAGPAPAARSRRPRNHRSRRG
jgi:ATP-dependent RNA helicase RhlE